MRLFIGLEPTPDFRHALDELQSRLRVSGTEGRYLDPANLHMTLAFIGEWPQDLTGVLPAVDVPFAITLSHLGIFSGAKVLWAGVEPSPALDALAARVRMQLDDARIPYDRQAFAPHITLLRKPVVPENMDLSAIEVPQATMLVHEVCLYQSVHEADGMHYRVLARSAQVRS